MDSPDISAKKNEVAQFLSDFKKAAKGQRPKVSGREKNLQTLADLGLTLNDQATIIFSLTPADYVSGPDRDHDRPGFVWVFGTMVEATELYIKLKIAEWIPVGCRQPVQEAKCISFHPSERPLTYPLK